MYISWTEVQRISLSLAIIFREYEFREL